MQLFGFILFKLFFWTALGNFLLMTLLNHLFELFLSSNLVIRCRDLYRANGTSINAYVKVSFKVASELFFLFQYFNRSEESLNYKTMCL